MEAIRLPGGVGRPRKRYHYVVADKGYDSDELRHYCDRHRMKPIIAQRKMYRRPRPGLPRGFDKLKYRERNVIERGFGWLYNHHIPQKALHHQTPIAAMKEWQAKRPELFTQRVVNHPGPDT